MNSQVPSGNGLEKSGTAVRLAKYLANAGIAARRKCEEYIAEGRVTVNGESVLTPAFVVEPGKDKVCYEGVEVKPAEHVYYLFNKPRGYTCSAQDPHAERLIYDILPRSMHSLFYVGRLDRDTEGLLILTNDGELANGITHPSHEIEKRYIVECDSPFTREDAARMLRGMVDDGDFLKAKSAVPIRRSGSHSIVEVVLTEGRKREIRRLFSCLGLMVLRLARVSIGCIELGDLASGEYRAMTDREIKGLRALVLESR